MRDGTPEPLPDTPDESDGLGPASPDIGGDVDEDDDGWETL